MTNLNKFKVDIKEIQYNRLFLLSDLHFGIRANSLEWLENQLSFFRNFYIPFLKENVKENDILFFLGDWFDSRQLLDIYIMNTAIDIMFELVDILPVYLMPGNHDIYKKYDTNVNSIRAFKYISNVTIFEKPVIITNKKSRILVLPWIGNKDIEENYVRANKFDYVFAHTDIIGFRYDNGKEIKSSSIDFMKFKGIKRIFSGHIHKRQEKNNIIYIGSPYHTKRGDIGNTKGVYIFNPDDNSISFFPNNFSPIYQRVLLENILEYTLDETKRILNNNYTDILVPDKYIHLFNFTKFIDILNGCNYKKIETIVEKRRFEDDFKEDSNNINIQDILSLLETNLEEMKYSPEILNKLKELNRNYYEKASNEDII